MRTLCVLVVVLAAAGCGTGGSLFRQYEYEEGMYLSLDGSATMYVNTSIAALNALRGTTLDTRPTARVDTDAVRRFYTSAVTRVVRVTTSRRSGRRYVHIRLEVSDLRKLHEAAPFAWSTYRLAQEGEAIVYKQTVGAPRGDPQRIAPHSGDELVAFRIHIPSVVTYHNAGPENLRRGNIVVWEQTLEERLKGSPLELEVRMEPQSILYTTLLLFGAMIAGVAVLFAGIIWLITHKGRHAKPLAP